jgi:ribosomal protein L11 methyltransferase
MTAPHARLAVRGASPGDLERAVAEAFEAGALGVEEHDGPPPSLSVYARAADGPRLREALARVAGLTLGPLEPVAEEAWAERWKDGLEAIVVSERLLVRPSFRAAPPGFRGVELVIDPGQAFGTGGHASTRLALEALAALPPARVSGAAVLDVGCGTGVLALAALALGAGRALGCDLDPLATAAARAAAAENGAAARLRLVTGSVDALGPRADGRFGLVLANLLRRELEPLLPALARLLAPGGRLVLSGLLEEEREAVTRALAAARLAALAERPGRDAGGERWLALEAGHAGEATP